MSIGVGERSLADLERGAKRCTTHHFACDCRELAYQKRIAELEDALTKIKNEGCIFSPDQLRGCDDCLDYIAHGFTGKPLYALVFVPCDACLARQALAGSGEVAP